MIKTAARLFRDYGAGHLLVLNRSVERAQRLARDVGGEADSLERLEDALCGADIVVGSVGDSPGLVKVSQVKKALHERNNRAIFIIDIAVPRNVEPAVNELDNVYLYNLDDLASLAEANARGRAEEARKAEEIVQEEARTFIHWLDTLEAVPTITRLTAWGEEVRRTELEKALAALGPMTEENRQVIEGLTNAIVRKLLHKPVKRIKQEREGGDEKAVLIAVKDLFDLDDEE
jgi:glutamyl-tRNA reductase